MRKRPGCGLEREEQEVATISTADFKNGMGLKINGKYYTIVEFQHVKPGKGGAFVRYKIRDLKSGRVIDQTCNAGTKFENVQLITKEMQYLYNDGDSFYFMDNETYEQIPVPADFIGDSVKWFKENDNCQLLYADTELLGVQPPMASWGQMISASQPYIQSNTYYSVIPGIAIIVTVMAFNLLGDAMRDALDPKMRS